MDAIEQMAAFIGAALGTGFVVGMILDGWSALWGMFWQAARKM